MKYITQKKYIEIVEFLIKLQFIRLHESYALSVSLETRLFPQRMQNFGLGGAYPSLGCRHAPMFERQISFK